MSTGARAPFAALALTSTAVMAVLKGFVALREASGGTLGLRVWNPDVQPALFVVRLAACVAETAALWIAVAAGASIATRWMPRARRPLQLAVAGLASLCAMLAVVDVQVYHVFHRFLDAALIDIGKGGGHGYIGPYAPPAAWAAFAIAPLAVVGLALGCVRAFREDVESLARLALHPVIAVLLVVGLASAARAAERWCGQGRGDFAHDPLLVLARSYVTLSSGTGDGDVTPEEAAALAPSPGAPPPPSPIKNVILVVWDGVPAAAMSLYGSPHRTTPELAKRTDTLVFDRFYSNATQSAPSALALFGSTYNDPTVYVTMSSYPRFPMPHAAPWLEKHGRRTYFVGDDGWTSLAEAYLKPAFQTALDAMSDWSRQPGTYPRPQFQVAASSYGLARRFINESGAEPFFITVWSSEAHPPFRAGECPEKFDVSRFPEIPPNRVDDYQRFLACCWREDHELAGLLADLEKSGKAASTLVIVTADHGCGWGQHGYFGYGAGLYDEITRVPFVLISPSLPRRGRSAAVGTHVDLWPTAAKLMGLPAHPEWQGRDLLEPAADGRTAYFSCLGEMGLRHDDWKYIWNHGKDSEELYDLKADPDERVNVGAAHPDLTRRYRRQLTALASYQSRRVRQAAH